MKKAYGLGLLVVCFLFTGAFAQQVETDIIQLRLNRFYFAAGIESGVTAQSSFLVACETGDTVKGIIEYAGPGISYSRPIAEPIALASPTGCRAWLSTAAVDSAAVITLGTDLPRELFDPEHETLFIRTGDTVISHLVDSVHSVGNLTTFYLRTDVLFSDGNLFTAGKLLDFLRDLKGENRSYLTRYFFSKLLPFDSGGVQLPDSETVMLQFYHPFPRAAYFLSHPDFAVRDTAGRGTGPYVKIQNPEGGADSCFFSPNPFYHGQAAAARLVIRYFDQQYRMKYAYENKQIDALVGFGFEADMAGQYEAKAMFPYVAVLISGIGGEAFSQGLFPTSLYYRFNPDLAHIYFQFGDVVEVNRWISRKGITPNQRYYPFDFLSGRKLQEAIRTPVDTVRIRYDQTLLYETARYMADIAAREGTTASLNRRPADYRYDIRLAFFPPSDEIMPFALIAAVLELNDQALHLTSEYRLSRSGWEEIDWGSQLNEAVNRNRFFARAEEIIVEDAAFFPLFRPYVYAVSRSGIRGLGFDFYGFPRFDGLVKFAGTGMENTPEKKQ